MKPRMRLLFLVALYLVTPIYAAESNITFPGSLGTNVQDVKLVSTSEAFYYPVDEGIRNASSIVFKVRADDKMYSSLYDSVVVDFDWQGNPTTFRFVPKASRKPNPHETDQISFTERDENFYNFANAKEKNVNAEERKHFTELRTRLKDLLPQLKAVWTQKLGEPLSQDKRIGKLLEGANIQKGKYGETGYKITVDNPFCKPTSFEILYGWDGELLGYRYYVGKTQVEQKLRGAMMPTKKRLEEFFDQSFPGVREAAEKGQKVPNPNAHN